MRLASGHNGLGLAGMPKRADIPECWGLYGVSQSGRMGSAALRLRSLEKKDTSSEQAQLLRQVLAQSNMIESGGINIIRPLLDFSKERLAATCRARGLQWEEDVTNDEIWRTPRNNIRALLRSGKLPQALRKSSMLQLAKKSNIYEKKVKHFMTGLQQRCEILLLDIRCGALIVRFVHGSRNGEKGHSTKYMQDMRLSHVLLLQYFVRIVSPLENVALQGLGHAARSIFPDIFDRDSADDSTNQPTSFTAGGVLIQRLSSPLALPQSGLDPDNAGKQDVLDPSFVWKMTRQPFSKPPPSLTVQASAEAEPAVEGDSSCWSSWQLWDGRYWIRLLNRSRQPLTVRPFQISDFRYLQSILSRQRCKELHQYLRAAAPGKVRWTLPAIAEVGDDSMPVGRLLALPTLGQAGTFDTGDADGLKKVEWQVRYKRIALGYHVSDDGYKVGRDKKMITSWQD